MQTGASRTSMEPSDAELITLTRAGEGDARAMLFQRHRDAATRLAARLGGAHNADDLVSESFSRVFSAIDGGGGPDLAFRPYLLTTVRNTYVTYVRTDSRHLWVDDFSTVDAQPMAVDETDLRTESSVLANAFRSLPERWQTVLWHTTVEQESPAEVGLLLGISPGAVAALSFRAREGLRQAYLSEHMQTALEPDCAEFRPQLPAYVRGRVSNRQSREIEDHLDDCYSCALVLIELREVGVDLGAVLAPAILGVAGAHYAVIGKAGWGILQFLGANKVQAVAGSAVSVVGISAAVAFGAWGGHSDPQLRSGGTDRPPALTQPSAKSTPSTAPTKPPATIKPVPRQEAITSTLKAASAPVKRPPASAPDQPVDVSISGVVVLPRLGLDYPTHVEMRVSSTAARTVVRLSIPNLAAFHAHTQAPYARVTCTQASPTAPGTTTQITCTLPDSSQATRSFGFDLRVDGPLSFRAKASAPGGTDPRPANNSTSFGA